MASLLPTLPLYVQDLGGTQAQIGWVMGSFAIGLLISRPTLGRWADRRSRVSVLRVGTTVVAIAPPRLSHRRLDSSTDATTDVPWH